MTPSDGEGIRFEAWEEVVARPAFEVDIDPRAVVLKHIVGTYNFKERHPCGLSTCHQPHGLGYVVSTDDGRETNIGATCGTTHFGVSFKRMRQSFDQARRHRDQLARLAALQVQVPEIRAEVERLKQGPAGATRLQGLLMQLIGRRSSLVPDKVAEAVRKVVRRGDGGIYEARRATAAERGTGNVFIDGSGRERRAPTVDFIDDRVGHLDGFAALAQANDMHSILAKKIEPLLVDLERIDLEHVAPKVAAALHKRSESLGSDLDQLRMAVSSAQRLLQRQNLEQLSRYAQTPGERRAFMRFLGTLPYETAAGDGSNSTLP